MTANQKQRILVMRQEERSFSEIADILGLSRNTVKSFCRRNQNPPCDASEETGIKEIKEQNNQCEHCNKPLVQYPKQKPRRFCDDSCRHAWWRDHRECLNKKALYPVVCAHCRKEFDSYGNKDRKYCCHACYITARFNVGARSPGDSQKAVAAT